MSNVLSFADAVKARKEFEQNSAKMHDSLRKLTQALINYYGAVSEIAEEGNKSINTMGMLYRGIYQSLTFEPMKDSLLLHGGILSPNANMIETVNEKYTTLLECVQLTNQYQTPNVPQNSLTVFAAGSENGFKELINYDVKEKLKDSPVLGITNDKEAMGVIYDYIYSHPDVDGVRDMGTLSTIAYSSCKNIIESGYALNRMTYSRGFDAETKRNMPSEIVLEFRLSAVNNNLMEYVYMLFDNEALFTANECMFYDLYSVDSKELREIVTRKD